MAHSQHSDPHYVGYSHPAAHARRFEVEDEDGPPPDYYDDQADDAGYDRGRDAERSRSSYAAGEQYPMQDTMALYRTSDDQYYEDSRGVENPGFRQSYHARNDSGQYDNDVGPSPRGFPPHAPGYPSHDAAYPAPYPDERHHPGSGYVVEADYDEGDGGRYSMDGRGGRGNVAESGVPGGMGGLRYRKHSQDHGRSRAHLHGGDEDRVSLESIDLSGGARRPSIGRELPSRNFLATLRIRRASKKRRRSLKIRHALEDEESEGEEGEGDEEEVGMPSLQRKKPATLQERLQNAREEHSVEHMADALRNQQGAIGSLKRQGKKTWMESRSKLKDWIYQFELWAGSFKEIEGRFGSATVSYFIFVRWLLFLNLLMFLIMFLVIVVPFLALPKADVFGQNSTSNATEIQAAVGCSRQYEDYNRRYLERESAAEKALDFVTGTGWMERTVLFYGIYYNTTVDDDPGDQADVYNMGLAYLLAVGICFLVSFLLILRSSAKTVKESVISQESSTVNFNNKVFCGWDFCIANEKAAKRRINSLVYELKRDLEEQRRGMKRAQMTPKDKCALYMKRLVINVVVLCILGATLYLIYFTSDQLKKIRNENLDSFVQLLVQYLPSITITVLNFIIPQVFAKIVLWEEYTPSAELKITLVRTVLLRLSSLAILIINLFIQFFDEQSPLVCGNRQTAANISCWETYFGQQFYKLTLLDFAAVVFLTFLVEFPRKFVVDRYSRFKLVSLVGVQEFDLPVCVLDIVYTQTLCWFGMMFSPLLPAITLVKVFLIFYMKKLSLMANCIPPVRAYQASRSKSFFMTVLLISFLLSVVPVGYIISKIPPSQGCGPFRVHSVGNFEMFSVITLCIETWPRVAREIFLFLGTPGFLIPIIILLCLLMYYYWASSQGNKKKEKLLQEQLKLEGKDKQFLLARVNEAYRKDLASATAGAMAN